MVRRQQSWWAPKKQQAQPQTSEWGAAPASRRVTTAAPASQAAAPAGFAPSYSAPSAGGFTAPAYQGTPAPKPGGTYPYPGTPAPKGVPGQYTPGQVSFGAGPGPLAGFQPGQQLPPLSQPGTVPQGPGSEAYQRALLGPAADLFPQGRPLRSQDMPLVGFGLNFQQYQQALMDRDRGIGALDYARGQVGTSPESVLAKELATSYATGAEGPYSDAAIDARKQGLVAQHRDANDAAVRELEADFARRGISGSLPALEAAMLERAGRSQTAQALGDFEENVAASKQGARSAALAQLGQIAAFDQTIDTDLINEIARAYLDSEHAPFDLAGLIETVPGGWNLVGSNQMFVEPDINPYRGHYLQTV